MRLKQGTITWFKYNRYKVDKEPIALILYGGDSHNNIHALNLNYLSNNLSSRVFNMVAQIASRRLKANDVRRLYYDYMKGRMHPVLAKAYRTYKPNEISRPRIISPGFQETLKWLDKFKRKFSDKEVKKIKTQVKKKVKAAQKAQEYIGDKATKMKHVKLTPEQAEKVAKQYMKMIHKITPGTRLDPKKFVGIRRRKK